MAAAHSNVLLPPDWNKAAVLRREKIQKRITEQNNAAKKMDMESIRARRARLEELTKAMKSPTRNRRTPYSQSLSAKSKVKLEPLGPRRSPNELDKKKQEDTLFKRPKSSHKSASSPTPAEKKYEEKLLQQWKKNREMGDDTRSVASLNVHGYYGDDQRQSDSDQGRSDNDNNDDNDDDDDDDEDDDDDNDERHSDDEKVKNDDPVDKSHKNGRGNQESRPNYATDEDNDKGHKPDLSRKEKAHPVGTDDRGKRNYETDKEEKVTPRIVKEVIRQMQGMTEEERLKGVYRARKHLSLESNPPIQMYVDEGAIPPLASCLTTYNPNLQFEAAWALTNISSGESEYSMAVYEAGAIPELIHLLNSPYNRVSDQCVWALGNLAGDGPFLWQTVVDEGAIRPLYLLIERSPSLSSLRNLSWTFSNLLRHKPLSLSDTDFLLCVKAVRLFLHHPDKEIHLNACWSLVYITDNDPERIEDVIRAGILPRLIDDLLDNSDEKTVTPSLRALGNIMTGNDDQTEKVVNQGIIPVLVEHLKHRSSAIRRDSAWALSNITAGTQKQIQAVLDAKALPLLADIMNKDDPKLKKEAAWCLSNMTQAGTKEQLTQIVNSNLVQSLTKTITQNRNDESLLVVAFEGLKNMAEKCNDYGRVSKQILEELSLDEIEEYTHSENEFINNSTSIIYTILSDEYD